MNSSLNQPTCKKIQNYIFRFCDLLGKGNFSKVYKAHNQVSSNASPYKTDDIVAIKIIELNSLKSKKLQQLLFSQIEVLKKLSHPNILRCHQVFTSNRNCYIITQLCNQGDLESKLRKMSSFTEDKARPIIKDIFLGLQYLASKNVIHRDLKIANVFMHNGKAKIADFGFAKFTKYLLIQNRQKFKDINIGSPIYMSPEGLKYNIYGPKTDVWAFGVMMYELLHGTTPFSNCRTESELKFSMSVPIGWSQLKNQLSSEIKEVILKCLEVDQERRVTIPQLRNLQFFKKMFSQQQQENNSSWVTKSINQLIGNRSDERDNKFEKPSSNILGFNWKEIDPFNYNANNPKTEKSNNNKSFKKEDSIIPELNNVSYSKNQNKNSCINRENAISPSALRKRQTSTNINTQQKDKIISSDLTFRACVNILHYCRLIYKFVTMLQGLKDHKSLHDQNKRNVFIRWLALVVKTVNGRINNQQVIYEGQNASLRQEKLKEVSKQYEKKYSKQLNLNLAKINPEQSAMANYDYMLNYLFTVYQQVDNIFNDSGNRENKNLLIVGHYIIMILQATKQLKKCYDTKNYKLFQTYKDVETLLNMKKDEMDLPSYWWYKKKYISNKK